MSTVQINGVSKHYGGVRALDDVALTIAAGEVRALVGENGSGKSTLMRVLSGETEPDEGTVQVDGVTLPTGDATARLRAGVGVVMQEPHICPNLTVAENLFVGRLPKKFGRVDWRTLNRQAKEVLTEAHIALDPSAQVGRLSQDEEHMTEVARVVARGCKVIAFDETTASLTEDHVRRLFDVIRERRAAGAAIVFITHRLAEVFELCDSVTVLRDGRMVGTRSIAETTEDEIVKLMVGRSLKDQFFRPAAQQGEARLKIEQLSSPGLTADFNFEVRAGEVLGIGGLVASGRSTLLESIYGLRPRRGSVHCDGKRVSSGDPRASIRAGMGFVPEDRRRQGLSLQQSVRENVALLSTARRGLLAPARKSEETALVQHLRASIALKAPDPEAPVRTLSGGNQQKIVLGRWLETPPAVLLLDEPTRGIDVGAKREIYDLIHGLAEAGTAVVLVSSELPELIGLSDRILVLHEGAAAGEYTRGVSDHDLGAAMTGLARSNAAIAKSA